MIECLLITIFIKQTSRKLANKIGDNIATPKQFTSPFFYLFNKSYTISINLK